MAEQGLGWWRTALGEYPTGVAVITSVDEEDEPIGMVVGSFSAVSEDPPMIGFMPMAGSRTFASIAERGRFAVSVLGSRHEELCRSFVGQAETRFTVGDWTRGTTGLLRLDDALVWFEATISAVHPAGDHHLVLATVDRFGAGDGAGGLPLLFLRGGYGTFAVPAPSPDFHEFSRRIRLASDMRAVIDEYARALDVECVLATVAGNDVVVLETADPAPDARRTEILARTSFPFAAPLAPTMAAWGNATQHKVWIENSRHLLGGVDRPMLAALLERVRARGYAVSLGNTMAERFDEMVADPTTDRAALSGLWSDVSAELVRLENDDDWHGSACSIQVPVMGSDGTAVMELVVAGFGPGATRARIESVVAGARATADRLAELAPPIAA